MIGKIILLTVTVLGFIASAIVVKRNSKDNFSFSAIEMLFVSAALACLLGTSVIFAAIVCEVFGWV